MIDNRLDEVKANMRLASGAVVSMRGRMERYQKENGGVPAVALDLELYRAFEIMDTLSKTCRILLEIVEHGEASNGA